MFTEKPDFTELKAAIKAHNAAVQTKITAKRKELAKLSRQSKYKGAMEQDITLLEADIVHRLPVLARVGSVGICVDYDLLNGYRAKLRKLYVYPRTDVRNPVCKLIIDYNDFNRTVTGRIELNDLGSLAERFEGLIPTIILSE